MAHRETRSALLASCLLLSAIATAVEPSHRCASIADAAARLACYDTEFPPPPEVREAVARRAEADFGLAEAPSGRPGSGQPNAAPDPDHIESRVASVAHHRDGRTISLQNGQSWMVTEATTRGQVNQGDAVRIRKGLLGNYMLITPAGAGLRVRRVR